MTKPRYRIERRLGDGAYSEVFLATTSADYGFQKEVAIKRLRKEFLKDDTQVQSFISEAKLVSQLQHPNIAAVLDCGVLDGAPFQVLELVVGHSVRALQKMAQGRKFPEALSLHIINEVANALDYVHNATNALGGPLGIVHRDINPSNILISLAGNVKLTDFGVARAFERPRHTADGAVRGTLAYMAPEQICLDEVDARTDIFALGYVLHELLTGVCPGEDKAVRDAVVSGEKPRLSPDIEAFGSDIRAIIERATAPAASLRYPNASAMSADCWRAMTQRLQRDGRQVLSRWIEDQAIEPAELQLFSMDVQLSGLIGEVRHYTQVIDASSLGADTIVDSPVELNDILAEIEPLKPRPATTRLDPGTLFSAGVESLDEGREDTAVRVIKEPRTGPIWVVMVAFVVVALISATVTVVFMVAAQDALVIPVEAVKAVEMKSSSR